MEFDSAKLVKDPKNGGTSETVLGDDKKHHSSAEAVNVEKSRMKNSCDVNMEASITADDVMRAGGFGARDDISSFLPVASDSTDFEASLRDAREYEEPQKDICRPGLGWKGQD